VGGGGGRGCNTEDVGCETRQVKIEEGFLRCKPERHRLSSRNDSLGGILKKRDLRKIPRRETSGRLLLAGINPGAYTMGRKRRKGAPPEKADATCDPSRWICG
jgi:hypothetical protein